jgi:ParB/RepB/Spo0J family partition protein
MKNLKLMTNQIKSFAIDRFVPHPDNPNRMSKANFAKLVRNIKLSGRYEPLVVRPCPDKPNYFQIINGHHRWQALAQLGYKQVDAVVWGIDDQQTDVLLATLNRLAGSDVLDRKITLLARLNDNMQSRELAKLLPMNAKQIERLTNLKDSLQRASRIRHRELSFANPLVFFVNDRQQKIIERALSFAGQAKELKTKAATNAAALTEIAEVYLAGREKILGKT